MNKSPYARQLDDGTFEFGVVLQQPGERDVMFRLGVNPNHATALQLATEKVPTVLDYFARATYATPSGAVGHWSGVVLAEHHAGALDAARWLVNKRRKVAGKLDIKLTGPGPQTPLVSLPDIAVILHTAGIQAGGGVAFEKIAADVLAYQVPTPPNYDTIGPAAFPRDAGMMIDVQNIVRAALRAIEDIRNSDPATTRLMHAAGYGPGYEGKGKK